MVLGSEFIKRILDKMQLEEKDASNFVYKPQDLVENLILKKDFKSRYIEENFANFDSYMVKKGKINEI